MKPDTGRFKAAAAAALANPQVQGSLARLYGGFHQARVAAADATPGWEAMRDRARAIKSHTLEHLDHYLSKVEARVTEAGGKVFFATDAAAATRYVVELARARGATTVTKGKSMVSEEIGLNARLLAEGIEVLETDLGEYIIQLAGETPFHIIAPAIHKSRAEVADLFRRKLGVGESTEIGDLTGAARRRLREAFLRADIGITGANFVVAETGTVVLVTNEGNGRMCTSLPRTHVVVTGMEKIVPSLGDLGIFLRLLIRSATGQRISSYVSMVTGPRRAGDADGPEELHLVIVDNGRSRLLADPRLREALYCLRCGACLNACPVYRKVGGHAYGWVYPGPIGAVVTPVLTGLAEAADLPQASTLCGLCREACPVRIDIPRMLLHLRHQLAEGGRHMAAPQGRLLERAAMRAFATAFGGPRTLGIARRLARLAQRPLVRHGRLRWLPPPLSGWTRSRDFPALTRKPFRERWETRNRR